MDEEEVSGRGNKVYKNQGGISPGQHTVHVTCFFPIGQQSADLCHFFVPHPVNLRMPILFKIVTV